MDEPITEIAVGLHFGILCESLVFQRWQADAIRELQGSGHQLTLLIMNQRWSDPAKPAAGKKAFFWSQAVFKCCHRYLFHPDAKKTVDLSEELEGIPVVSCLVEQNGHSQYFGHEDVTGIRNHKLDFILRFGFGILRGDILNAARYGIWSFHHDDELKYRGGPPGFWEIHSGDPVSGAILQRLTERLDAGIILKKGYLKTVAHSYSGNLDQLLSVSASWPALVADDIIAGRFEFPAPSATDARVYKIPSNGKMITFLFRIFWNKLLFHLKELFRAELWNVGIIHKPIHEIALGNQPIQAAEVIWTREMSNSKYLADPAGFFDHDKLHILVEDYSYSKQYATISEVIWDSSRNSFSVPIRTIEGHHHLSYPFILEHQKIIYCIPESYRDRNIGLYKRNFSEEAFIEEKILLKDVDAVDPTLILYEQRWWLFFTIKKYSNTHLHIYYSDHLLGDFQPHAKNPVKIDIRSSRPAGTPFHHDGILYRPAQDCTQTYGSRVVVNRIIKLTETEFEEVTVSTVEPVAKSRFSKGLHTLSAVGAYTLIDGKRFRFNGYYFKNQFRKKLTRKRNRDV